MDSKLTQETLNLVDPFQNVTLQTQSWKHTVLDLNKNESHKENLVSDISNEGFLSYHCIIKFQTALPSPPTERITITYRNLGRIDLDTFTIDPTAKPWHNQKF